MAGRLPRPAAHGLLLVGIAGCLGAAQEVSSPGAVPGPGPPHVLVTQIDTEITPVVADHLAEGIDRAARQGASAYVVVLDTPGGLVDSTREIVQDILASKVPVIVHVAPEGARAASAGAVITLASHVAVMAPGTSIGAATPVGLQGEDLSDKVVNDAAAQAEALARRRGRDVGVAGAMVREGRALTVEEAVRRDVVDAEASTRAEALEAADGRTVDVPGERVTLTTAGATIREHEFGWFRQVLQFLANPNLSFLLFTLGVLGLLYELASPGMGVAGTVGAVSLLLALFSVAVLPVTAVGLLLLAVAAGLFLGELLAPATGGLAAGGGAVLVLASLFLFDDAQGVSIDLAVALPVAVVMTALAVLAGRLAVRSQRAPTRTSGKGLLVGTVLTVHEVAPDRDGGWYRARAFADGAWWPVRSREQVDEGQRARVLDVEGITLLVRPLPTASTSHPEE